MKIPKERNKVERKVGSVLTGVPQGSNGGNLPVNPGKTRERPGYPPVVNHRRAGAEVLLCVLEHCCRRSELVGSEVKPRGSKYRLGAQNVSATLLHRLVRGQVSHQ